MQLLRQEHHQALKMVDNRNYSKNQIEIWYDGKNQKTHIADIDQVVIVSIYNKIKLKFKRTSAGIVEQQTIRFWQL
jgi:hypothetical protein